MPSTLQWIVCFPVVTLDDTGRHGKICVPLEVQYPRYEIPPLPPVFSYPNVNPEDVRHMQTLAAIHRMSEMLPEAFSRDIQNDVAEHMRAFGKKLGADVELSLHSSPG